MATCRGNEITYNVDFNASIFKCIDHVTINIPCIAKITIESQVKYYMNSM